MSALPLGQSFAFALACLFRHWRYLQGCNTTRPINDGHGYVYLNIVLGDHRLGVDIHGVLTDVADPDDVDDRDLETQPGITNRLYRPRVSWIPRS